jgi:ankyrin repeat protein
MSKQPGWIGTTLNLFRTMRRWLFSKDDIHVEAAKGNLENLQSLLTKNPELVNLIDKMDYGTPLHWAALYGQAESCKLLLEQGADLKLVDDLGYSPLRWAVDGGEPGIVELLIAHGADVNQKDQKGLTPLDVALRKKQVESAAILRDHGAKESGFQDRAT